MPPDTAPNAGQDRVTDTAAQRAESARQVAESSATAYVEGIAKVGGDPSEVGTRQAFIDGFLTAIESLLTMGERR